MRFDDLYSIKSLVRHQRITIRVHKQTYCEALTYRAIKSFTYNSGVYIIQNTMVGGGGGKWLAGEKK